MATLGQETKNLRSELQEHRVNAVEGTVDLNQKGRQNCDTILQLLSYKRTYTKLVPQEYTR